MSLKDKFKHLYTEMFIEPKNQRAQDYHHIDPKIAPLVSALGQLPSVKTIASCQGHACGRVEAPYVYFKAENTLVTGLMTLLRQCYQRGELHHSWELTGMFNHQSELCWSLSSPYYDRRFATSSVITLGWRRDKVDHDIKTLTHLIATKSTGCNLVG
ncbi:hypothetical protein ACWX0P_17580 [Vibrio mediterranei]